MSQPPSPPTKLLILAPGNAALVRDAQVDVPSLARGQRASNGCSVEYEGRHLTVVRVDDETTGSTHIAMMSHQANYAGASDICRLKSGPEGDACSSDEDPRLFVVGPHLYVLYNSAAGPNRHMRVARVLVHGDRSENSRFSLEHDKQIDFTNKQGASVWEKYWSPFVHDGTLHLIYQASPPIVLRIETSQLESADEKVAPAQVSYGLHAADPWKCGEILGGTGAVYDAALNRYVTFFHSSVVAAGRQNIALYCIVGMYTFMPEPPFEIERITSAPLVAPNFYDAVTVARGVRKSTVLPVGLADGGNNWLMMYGKNDATLHVATWRKAALLKQTVLCSGA